MWCGVGGKEGGRGMVREMTIGGVVLCVWCGVAGKEGEA